MVFGAEVCSLVVQLLQSIQVLTDHSGMQICRKLALALQAVIRMLLRQTDRWTDRLLDQLIGRRTVCSDAFLVDWLTV